MKLWDWLLNRKTGYMYFNIGEYSVRVTFADVNKIRTKEDLAVVFEKFVLSVMAEYERQGKEPPSPWYIISRSRVTANVQAKLNEIGKAMEEGK